MIRQDKQLVELILQPGAINVLQKRVQQNDIIKRAAVKPKKNTE